MKKILFWPITVFSLAWASYFSVMALKDFLERFFVKYWTFISM